MGSSEDMGKNERNKTMQMQEFVKRTPFLDKTDHDHYEDWFEPAYMGAKNIDKDDFCAMLKDKTVRKFVQTVSEAFKANEATEKDLTKECLYVKGCNHALQQRCEGLRKAVSLISANCDRVLAEAVA